MNEGFQQKNAEKKLQSSVQPVQLEQNKTKQSGEDKLPGFKAREQILTRGTKEQRFLMAERIARDLAVSKASMPPLSKPAPLKDQQKAHLSKQQKKQNKQILRRQRENEEKQRQLDTYLKGEYRRLGLAEVKEWKRKDREIAQREMKEKRLNARKALYNDPEFFSEMEKLHQNVTDEQAEIFLRRTVDILTRIDPSLKRRLHNVATYDKVILAGRLIINDHLTGNGNQISEDLMKQVDGYEEGFRMMEPEGFVTRAIDQELADVLAEEFEGIPELKETALKMSLKYMKDLQVQINRWRTFEAGLIQYTNVDVVLPKTCTNHIDSASPFAYLGRTKTQEAFKERIRQVMKEKNLDEKAAMDLVYKERREKLQEDALKRSAAGSVIPGVSMEDWLKHGGASFHQTLPAAEALKAVKNSHGRLYAKDLGEGLMELRPTLPDSITIGGKEYTLRRDYNLLIKSLTAVFMDKEGKLLQRKTEEGEKSPSELIRIFEDAVSAVEEIETMREPLKAGLKDVLEEAIKSGQQDVSEAENVDEACERLLELFRVTRGEMMGMQVIGTLLTSEIMGSLSGFLSIMKMVEETPMDQRLSRMNDAMKRENTPEPERNKNVKAVKSFYADTDKALDQMRQIRNMDINSMDVPLHNACSANGLMFENLSKLTGEGNQFLRYYTNEHMKVHPEIYIEYILTHPHLCDRNPELLPKVEAMKNQVHLSEEQIEILDNLTKGAKKYLYHVAANLGQLPGNVTGTIEGFAAEAKEAVVSPFTLGAAVGLYRGETESREGGILCQSGMISYYNHDNPLPSEEESLLVERKQKFVTNSFPGDL